MPTANAGGKACAGIDARAARSAFKKYTGDFYQIPPMVSALNRVGTALQTRPRRKNGGA